MSNDDSTVLGGPVWSFGTPEQRSRARAVGPVRPAGRGGRGGDPGRRPLGDDEHEAALALGLVLVDLRRARGLTQTEVASRAGVATRTLRRLERGERRTRVSTLARLARAIDQRDPDLVQALVRAAGVALAPESEFAERIERRRQRRHMSNSKRYLTEQVVTRTTTTTGVLEVTVLRRRVSRNRVTESSRSRVIPLDESTPGRMVS